jgi:hypothetical protein
MDVNTTESLLHGPIANDSDDSHLANVAHVVRSIERDYCTNRSPSCWHQLEGMSVYGDLEVKSERHCSARDGSDEVLPRVADDVEQL